jgi:hypothetical protein
MIHESLRSLITSSDREKVESALRDESALFWVEWDEDDDQIPGRCEAVIGSGSLSCDWSNDSLIISFRDRRVPVPLSSSPWKSLADSPVIGFLDSILPIAPGNLLRWPTRGDRHVTLCALDKALHPDFELRYARASRVEGVPALAPLPPPEWAVLEQDHGKDAVSAAFSPLRVDLNLFL